MNNEKDAFQKTLREIREEVLNGLFQDCEIDPATAADVFFLKRALEDAVFWSSRLYTD